MQHLETDSASTARLFINGRNQAVRLPQALRFPEHVTEVEILRQGDGILLRPKRPDWLSLADDMREVPEDFMTDREQPSVQDRDPFA